MSTLKSKYTLWQYLAPKPGTNPRRRWRGNADMIKLWAWAPASPCGTYFETASPRGGYLTEADARAAAELSTKGATP